MKFIAMNTFYFKVASIVTLTYLLQNVSVKNNEYLCACKICMWCSNYHN